MKTYRSKKYLAFIREKSSLVSGSDWDIVAHHVRCLGGGGMGLKPPDCLCVPLTASEHRLLHDMGERTFWLKNKIDLEKEIIRLQSEFLKTNLSQLKYTLTH